MGPRRGGPARHERVPHAGEWLAEKMRQEDAYAQAQREALAFESWGASSRPYLTRPELQEREAAP